MHQADLITALQQSVHVWSLVHNVQIFNFVLSCPRFSVSRVLSVQGEPDVLQPGSQQQCLRPLLRAGHPFTQQIPDVSALGAIEER